MVLLSTWQCAAFVQQWRLGFRPFAAPAHRVPLSWDMFAVQIERCDLRWDPPVYREGKPLASLHGLAAPLDWEPVYDTRGDYVMLGSVACARRGVGHEVSRAGYEVRCFVGGAREIDERYVCN